VQFTVSLLVALVPAFSGRTEVFRGNSCEASQLVSIRKTAYVANFSNEFTCYCVTDTGQGGELVIKSSQHFLNFRLNLSQLNCLMLQIPHKTLCDKVSGFLIIADGIAISFYVLKNHFSLVF